MDKNIIRKVCFTILFLFSVGASFVCGYFFGKTTIYKKPIKEKFIKFYTSKKNINKEILNEEKKIIKIFIHSYEECLKNKLDENEKTIIKNIEEEVLGMSENNNFVKFKVFDLKIAQNDRQAIKKTISKIRSCQKASYKHMTKIDRRIMRKGMSKMNVKEIIKLFHGIR